MKVSTRSPCLSHATLHRPARPSLRYSILRKPRWNSVGQVARLTDDRRWKTSDRTHHSKHNRRIHVSMTSQKDTKEHRALSLSVTPLKDQTWRGADVQISIYLKINPGGQGDSSKFVLLREMFREDGHNYNAEKVCHIPGKDPRRLRIEDPASEKVIQVNSYRKIQTLLISTDEVNNG